jgi:hypothetical protein
MVKMKILTVGLIGFVVVFGAFAAEALDFVGSMWVASSSWEGIGEGEINVEQSAQGEVIDIRFDAYYYRGDAVEIYVDVHNPTSSQLHYLVAVNIIDPNGVTVYDSHQLGQDIDKYVSGGVYVAFGPYRYTLPSNAKTGVYHVLAGLKLYPWTELDYRGVDWCPPEETFIVDTTHPTPRIYSVEFNKDSITPGDWVTLTVKAINNGGTAEWQTIHIGLPFTYSTDDIQIVSSDLSNPYPIVYPPGTKLPAAYGAYSITSKYVMVEGAASPWPGGAMRYITIRVKFPDISTCAFDIKTVAKKGDRSDPNSGMVDQQDEYVKTYSILKKFTVSVRPGESKVVEIPITNHARTVSGKVTQPSMVVTGFVVTNDGGFKGTITATNLNLNIPAGSTGLLKINVAAAQGCPENTYVIKYKVNGTP